MLHDTSYLPSWKGMDAYWDGEPSKNDLPIYIFFAYDNLGTLLDMVAGAFRRAHALTNRAPHLQLEPPARPQYDTASTFGRV